MPIIFANSIMMLPATLALIFPAEQRISLGQICQSFQNYGALYSIGTFILIILFA